MKNILGIGEAVYELLTNSPAVTAQVGDGIYPVIADEGVDCPFVIFSRADTEHDASKDGLYGATAAVDVLCCSDTYQGSIDLALAVTDSLTAYRGTVAGYDIEGITLSKKLDAEGAQSEKDVVKWAMQICDVLGYLHTRTPKIIYRDTKPSNIMLKPDGDVVLIDFGTARVYRESAAEDTTLLGTKGYAAPEQYGGQGQTDERTDIFNLGATMYHLLTGHNPAQPPYEMYPIRKWNSNLSSGLEQIILKCTKNNPDERYQNCADLMYALEHYVEYEEGYMQKQKRRMVLTGFVATLSVACFIGSSVLSGMVGNMTSETYAGHVKNAGLATSDEGMLEQYRAALALDPGRSEAYTDILKYVYLKDGNYTQEEAEEMLALLGTPYGGSTYETTLRQNPAEYEELAYQIGLAYFYYYNETGNKPMAKPWFADAMGGHLDPAKHARAERLYRISDYYNYLGYRDPAGDNMVSYGDYWRDLENLTAGNLVESDNERTALVMYREVVYQILMHANDFRKASIPKTDMQAALENIESRLKTDFNTGRMDVEDGDVVAYLEESIPMAYNALDVAFGVKETENYDG